MAKQDEKTTVWLHDPLETEEDAEQVEDMVAALEALGRSPTTVADAAEFQRLVGEAKAKRLARRHQP